MQRENSSRTVLALALTLVLTGCHRGNGGGPGAPVAGAGPAAPGGANVAGAGPAAPGQTANGGNVPATSRPGQPVTSGPTSVALTPGTSQGSVSLSGKDSSWVSAVRSTAEVRPSAIMLTAAWCPNCQQIKTAAWDQARVAYTSLTFREIDVDKDPESARLLGYTRGTVLPTFVFRKDNQEFSRFSGPDPVQLRRNLDLISAGAPPF